MPDRRHGERAVGPWTNAQPKVGLLSRSVRLWVDDGHACATAPRVRDAGCLRKPRPRGIVPPQDNHVGFLVVRKADPPTKRQCVGIILVPAADFDGIDQVGTAETSDEALDPFEAVDHGGAAW